MPPKAMNVTARLRSRAQGANTCACLSTKLANADDYPKLEVVRAGGAARD